MTSRSPVERSLPTELVLLHVRLVRYYDAQSLFVIKKGESDVSTFVSVCNVLSCRVVRMNYCTSLRYENVLKINENV